jgi:hypothetical protein
MGAVLLFIAAFTCAWVNITYGPEATLLVAGCALLLFLLLDVLLPTVLANRAWFAWQLANRRTRSPRHPGGAAQVRSGAHAAETDDWLFPGRPDLNAEIRVTGWDGWAAGHRLRVLDVAADPGHPGGDLTLLEVAAGRWSGARLVQVVDASPNHLGIHERHGLPVPPTCETALDAIAATWGLTAETYRPQRHT